MSKSLRRLLIGQAIAITAVLLIYLFLARDDHPPLPKAPAPAEIES